MKIEQIIEAYSKSGLDATVQLVAELYTQLPSTSAAEQPTASSIRLAVLKCFSTYQKLNKSSKRPQGKADLDSFLATEYALSTRDVPAARPASFARAEIEALQKLSTDLSAELQETTEHLGKVEEGKKWKEMEIEVLNKMLIDQQDQLEELKKGSKRASAREEYYRSKVAKLEESQTPEENRIFIHNRELHQQKQELLASVGWLESLLADDSENAFDLYSEQSRCYTTECQKCVYELLNHNVSVSKIGAVIKSVLAVTGKVCDRVPSKSTVLEMNLQRLHLAQQQLGEVFASEQDTCLLTDETSKRGKKYMGYEATDSSGCQWVLGVREITSKSAADTLTVFRNILSDIDYACHNTKDEASRIILQHIASTMSDRAATEVKFNTLLQEYKESVVPVIDRCGDMPQAEQQSVCRLAHFFCGLHSLAHMAETAEATIKRIEDDILPTTAAEHGGLYKRSEAATIRLVRTCSKAFAAGADEKSGVYGHFIIFVKPLLEKNSMRSLPIVPFRGSRFNILFMNAAGTFFLHREMLRFLSEYGAENKLTKAVLKDLQVPELLAACKALGLVGKLVTEPLWFTLESKEVHIFDMNRKYQQLLQFFTTASDHMTEFMEGRYLPFGEDTYVNRDSVYQVLMDDTEYDPTTEVYLRVMFPAMAVLCRRMFADHLSGGTHTLTDSSVPAARKKYESVPKTSKYAESVFGLLDHLMTQKPNISTLASEAYIMFCQNKTHEWITAMKDDEQVALLATARRSTKSMKKKFKLRKQDIEQRKRAELTRKIQQREAAAQKKVQLKEKCTCDIIAYGLWQSKEEVDRQLVSYESTADKKAALKCQLRFRKSVLAQQALSGDCYNFTKAHEGKRISLTVDELSDNVKLLVQSAVETSAQNLDILVHRRVRHRFIAPDDEAGVWYPGKIISQVYMIAWIYVQFLDHSPFQ